MRILHALANILHKRQHDQCSNGVADESGDTEDKRRERDQYNVQTHVADTSSDALGDCVQQARISYSLPERQAASGKDNNRPKEIVEIFFVKNACTEEQDKRNDGYHTHASEYRLQLM